MNDFWGMTNDIREFCESQNPKACSEGRDWALANCRDMAEAWDRLPPGWLIWVATRPGVLDNRTLRLWACWYVRHTPLGDGRVVWDLLTDERSRRAVEVAERYARGEATDTELAAAARAAAARAAVREAAEAAAEAAWAAVREAAEEFQAAELRRMVANPFMPAPESKEPRT